MSRDEKRKKLKQLVKEERNGGFRCCYCGQRVPFSELIGTQHRNHCPFCLYSKHVDLEIPGDRKAKCKTKMKPIALTFKHEGIDKWGKPKRGELMLVNQCAGCGKISLNRIAADDNPDQIIKVLENSKNLEKEIVKQLNSNGIEILTGKDKREILVQLFGRNLDI